MLQASVLNYLTLILNNSHWQKSQTKDLAFITEKTTKEKPRKNGIYKENTKNMEEELRKS